MSEKKEEGQKTIVSFVVGLLIGGLLVWAFTGGESTPREAGDRNRDTNTEETRDNGDESTETEDKDSNGTTTVNNNTEVSSNITTESLPTGDGSVSIENKEAGMSVAMASATFPTSEGWVGVRDFANGEIGNILGVARYSQSQGLIPEQIILQRPTVAGKEYAIVFFNENGDRKFDAKTDTRIGGPVTTFTAE